MTFEDLQTLVDYHYWARDRLWTVVEALSDEQLRRPLGSSFASVFDTMVHLCGADWIWRSRWDGVSPMALAGLKSYAWPGNVRELRNVIERLMIMVPGDVIEAADLAFLDIGGMETRSSTAPVSVGPLFEARDAWERDYTLSALATFDGNISRTAEALGIERSNLYKKMRGLGIAPREREEP